LTLATREAAKLIGTTSPTTPKEESMSTTTGFNLTVLTDAIEARDAAAQLELYAPDAAVTIIDRISQPGTPRVLRGREQISGWIEDTCARDMTHEVQHAVRGEDSAAFVLACRYTDGTNVACATVLELAGGRIADQTIVQAWDEQ
jgi:ketosteroid isomerase-like protein